jgi:hypothetical protein
VHFVSEMQWPAEITGPLSMRQHLRIARPVADIERSAHMYCQGLRLRILSSFRDHDGFDGIMIGVLEADYHLEFTQSRRHPVAARPTPEDILVFYYPDESEWRVACEKMHVVGFELVSSFNPFWDLHGRTYQDSDGYRVVLQQAVWSSAPESSGGD